MEELIKKVSEKTGLSPDQAKSAVETVVNYLKTKLPAPLAGELDSLLAGGGGQLGDLAKGLGGMFGQK
jgi:ribosomal protein L7/L12